MTSLATVHDASVDNPTRSCAVVEQACSTHSEVLNFSPAFVLRHCLERLPRSLDALARYFSANKAFEMVVEVFLTIALLQPPNVRMQQQFIVRHCFLAFHGLFGYTASIGGYAARIGGNFFHVPTRQRFGDSSKAD